LKNPQQQPATLRRVSFVQKKSTLSCSLHFLSLVLAHTARGARFAVRGSIPPGPFPLVFFCPPVPFFFFPASFVVCRSSKKKSANMNTLYFLSFVLAHMARGARFAVRGSITHGFSPE
jgi:hypothetical protein